MGVNNNKFTILHVEDDPVLVKLVQMAFENFGFRGSMISAGRVDTALGLLAERERNQERIDLILVDMELPDGTGLDVIREVKSNPAWLLTPVIVLSSNMAAGTINGAYALGANCYVSKIPKSSKVIEALRALYVSWLENALLPRMIARDRLQNALSRAVQLRARTAEFYLGLARIFEGQPEMGFWLDRSLNEGNLSNLLAFFLPKVSEKDLPPETLVRLASMQEQVKKALEAAEERLKKNPAPQTDEVYRWTLDLIGALDEEVVAECIGYLFPKGPEATTALKARAALQMKELAGHILAGTKDLHLRQEAGRLHDWAGQIASIGSAPVRKVMPGG